LKGLEKNLPKLIQLDKFVVEPIVDLLSLGGIIKHKAKKQKNIDEIIKMKEDSIAKMIK
jgi:hypothetical protein